MAGNAKTNGTWYIDTTGALEAGGCEVCAVYLVPNGNGDSINLTDADNDIAIYVQGKSGSTDPVYIPFVPPRKLASLSVQALSASATAYVYLLKTDHGD